MELEFMQKNFYCTNKSYDKSGPLYINNKEQLERIDDTYINLRCYVDDFFIAITELGRVENKVVHYFVKINGTWYHIDLVFDLYNIKHNNEISYFLKSEKYMLKDEDHQICTYYAESKEISNRSIPVKTYKALYKNF